MKVQCLHCKTLYNVDEAKIPAGGANIKCRKCDQKIHIPPVQQAPPESPRTQPPSEHLPEIEAARGQIAQSNEDAAVKVLYDGITRYADQKRFGHAERLRDELMEIAPMAITEIVGSAEIIESRKTAAMDQNRLSLWKDLFAPLSESERAAFYFALTDADVKAGELIFKQGEMDNRIYMIQSGRFQVRYYDHQHNKNNDFAVLEAGDIAGADSFFQFTNHTVSLAALEDSRISRLDKSAFEKILQDNPTLEAKVSAYCTRKARRFQLTCEDGASRRAHQRYECNLSGHIQILENGTKSGGIIPALVTDISRGGACCMVQNLKKEQANQFLGSRILIRMANPRSKTIREVNQSGKVVSVRILPFEECSVHAHFLDLLDEDLIIELSGHERN